MVSRDVLFHIGEGLEAFEKTILENCVEFVLNTCQQSVLLIDVETELVESGVPVQLV